MTWQALIFISVFLGAISTILQRILLREDKSDAVAYSIFFQLLTGILIAVFGLIQGSFTFPDVRPFLLPLALMIVLYAAGNIFIFKTLNSVEASEATVIFSSRALFTIIASTIFIGEVLNQKQLLGVVLILLSIIIVSFKASKFSFGKPEFIALLAAIAFGVATTNDRFLLKNIALYPYVSLAFFAPAILVILLNPKKAKKMAVFFEKKLFLKMLLMCVAYALTAITFFSALQIAPTSSQVVTINLTGVIVTVLLSIVFLKERGDLGKKLLSALLCFGGLLLLG